MYKSIKIRNLRAITNLEIDDLAQVNLFVGNNGCGKTTVLEALFFLIGATNPKLPVNANAFRGLPVVNDELWGTFFHDMDSSLAVEIMGEVRETGEKEKLVIRAKMKSDEETPAVPSASVSVEVETADSKPSVLQKGLELEYWSSEYPDKPIVTSIVRSNNDLVATGTKERPVRGVFVGPTTRFNWRGRFGALQRNKLVNDLIVFLREMEPTISDVRLNDAGFLEADIGLPSLIPVNLMGGGIAEFMSAAVAMLDHKNGIILIDEIEGGLHYSAQEKIWKAILSWAQGRNVQVFATTHSYECIRAFCSSVQGTLFESAAKLFRIERKDDKFRAIEYSKEVLAESLDSSWEVR